MESNIPVPTDNINKFYAIFGLIFIVSCVLGDIYLLKETAYLSCSTNLKLATLQSKDSLTKEEEMKKNTLEYLKNFTKLANGVYHGWLLAGMIFGAVLMLYGFFKWHYDVQPQQDKLLKLQISKLEKEIAALDYDTTKKQE